MRAKLPSLKIKELLQNNPFESAQDIGTGVVDSFKNDLGKEAVNGLWDQMLGAGAYEKNGGHHIPSEMQEGQELDLRSLPHHELKNEQPKQHIEAGINYSAEIIHTERHSQETSREMQVTVQEILIEIRKIMSESKELQVAYKEIAVEQHVVKPGKYHVNFFSFFLNMLRDVRLQIEDSGAWLAAMKSKKGEKTYWNQFKKHGTSFGLSNERTVATQTG